MRLAALGLAAGSADLGPHARPLACRALDAEAAAECLDPVGEAAQARAARRRSAPPAPSSATSMRATPSSLDARTVTSDAFAYFATFVSDSATT